MIGIYKITSPSKKVYIGQSIDIYRRWSAHKKLINKKQKKLYNSFLKYGSDNHKFEIICECNVEELNNKERYYQDLYSAIGRGGLNSNLTKADDRSGKFSAEAKLNMRNSHLGKKLSIDTKLKKSFIGKQKYLSGVLKIGIKGEKMSDERKLKIKISNTGKKNTKEHIRKVFVAKTLKEMQRERDLMKSRVKRPMPNHLKENLRLLKLNMSDEYREKLRIANTGKKALPKTLLRLSASHAHQTNANLRVSVIQMDLWGKHVAEFVSIAQAAREVAGNVSANPNIVRAIKKNRTAYGFRWKYNKMGKQLVVDQNKIEQTNLFSQT